MANEMNFVINHAPGAEWIARPLGQQSSVLAVALVMIVSSLVITRQSMLENAADEEALEVITSLK